MKKTKTSEVKAHADFGASKSKQWLMCPGSIKLSKDMPSYESKYATEGTEAHACLEFLLKNRKQLQPAIFLAEKKYSRDMVQHALESVEYILKHTKGKDSKLFIETRVDSSAFTTKDQFSTLDVAIAQFDKRTLHIMDYKYGAGIPVEVKDNSQLIYYGLAMLLHIGHKQFDHVVLTVLQPRAEHHTGDTIRTHQMTVEEVLKWGVKFKKGVKAALAENPPLASGDHCQFCPAKIKCPVLREQSFKDAAIDFSPVKSDIGTLPKIQDIKDIGKLLAACEKLEVFIAAVKERAYNDAKRGIKVNGYKLVAQRTSRQWNNPDKVQKIAVKALGSAALTEPKLLSPAQFEKKFKKKKAAMEWLKKNVVHKPGGITLAKESDKRKATSIIDADFDVIGDVE